MMKKGSKMPMTEETKRKISQSHIGLKPSPETRKKMSLARIGKPAWNKGKVGYVEGNVGYYAIHMWVKRWKGKANHCEVCGATKKKRYHWANIDHKYRKVLEDFIAMCPSCHRKYDNEKNKGKRTLGVIKKTNK